MLLMTLIQETATSSFDDLGKLLLYGVGAAIVLAVGFTVVRFRMNEKKPPSSKFISITDKDPSSSV